MGQLGMSLEDFLAISPSEFSALYAQWLRAEEIREQNAWERARWTVFHTLCPPEKKTITIFDIEKFKWDPELPKEPISTRERFEEMKKKYGERI